ncbi:plectin-like [Musca vetustissima]|uniref:plectin-like n=1 Tax=Musca vetustissima TaxID=27455 RepID=UPI002AB6B962|nr:plectin-like [Musca vetustissima]
MPSAKQKTSVFAKDSTGTGLFQAAPPNSKLPSSPSSSEANSTLSSQLSLPSQDESEEKHKHFLEYFFDSDSESLEEEEEEEEEPDYLKRSTLEEKVEFLQDFGSIPELENISEDVSISEINKEIMKPEISSEEHSDIGYFVDPITGQRLVSTPTVQVVKKDLPQFEEKRHESVVSLLEFEEVMEEEDLDKMDIFNLDYNQEDDKDLNVLIDEERALEKFLQVEIREVAKESDLNWEEIFQQEAHRHLCENVERLLNDLIDQAVEVAEHISPEAMLRKHLDKHKLVMEIRNKVHERVVERRVCEFFNRKAVEYFKRKKILRSIMPDSKRYVELEMRKYLHAISRLDELLAKEENAKLMASKTQMELENELQMQREKSEKAIADFEEVVRRNLIREARPKCNMLIEKLLLEMSKCRQEVNEVRFEMILKLHTEASLRKKLSNIEDLGNGLTMKSFEGIHNETQILDRKIEERNAELRKLYERVQRDIHAMAHYKEQQKMLQNSIIAQRLALEELMEEKRQLRQQIYELRMNRNSIRKQHKELSFESGLLDKPALMLDYDKTNEMIAGHRGTVKAKTGNETPKKIEKKSPTKEKGKEKGNKAKTTTEKVKIETSIPTAPIKPLPTTNVPLKEIPMDHENRKRSSEESISSLKEELPTKQPPPPPPKKLRLTEINPLEKAIAEVVMEGEGSSESHESEYNGPSSESSIESFITQAEKFLELPGISDEEDRRMDMGAFVNPLTGEISSSSKESLKEKIEEPKEVVKQKPEIPGEEQKSEKDVEESIDLQSVDIPILSDEEAEDEGKKLADEEDTFNQFLELEAQAPVVTTEEIDMEALARAEAERLLNEQTYEFVCDLISRAVDKAEYVDPRIILRQNLDKRKLMKELQEKIALLEIEKRGKQFLNRKCVEYFRRKRSMRPILEDNLKMLPQEIRKYQAAVNNLDKWLIREQEAKALTETNLAVLNEELTITRKRSGDEISNLEDIVRKALRREGFDKLHGVVENLLGKMQSVRKEISKVRFQLIQKQHDMATLVEQLRDLEDLGNGLTMRNFETIQTETQALGKKIEERNTELNKLRYRCHGDIHRQAHLKEKQKMLHETIHFQRQYLEELQNEKQRLREVVFQMKIERSKLRKESRDISFQSGLLDKPILMKDFDTTVEYLEELRERVKQSKITICEINEKN